MNSEEVKIGVYICHCGGNISDKVDVEKVAEDAGNLPDVTVSRTYTFMCADPGQELIVEDIEKHGLNRIVVASCSPSLHETTFRSAVVRGGLNQFLYEHVNIREQVSWVHASTGEATAKATTLVRAAIARVRHHEPLSLIRVGATSRALVLGGGVAGLRAALDLAVYGLPVTIVEKSSRLGGQVAEFGTVFPTGESGAELVRTLVRDVSALEEITVLTGARVTGATGYVGNFTVMVEQERGDGSTEDLEIPAGAVIVATGSRPYEPDMGEFGFGQFPEVVTLPDFLQILNETRADGDLTVNGKMIRRAAFIHCVGSRQIEGIQKPKPGRPLNENCSRICCTATLKAESDLIEKFPGVFVYDLYRDIRTYGRNHEEIYERASRDGVSFLCYEPATPPVVTMAAPDDTGNLLITVKDNLTAGMEIEVAVDLVVLAVGMEPADVGPLAESLKLPAGADGFLQEVHPKLRPVEMAVAGVVLAGTCQSPRDIEESCASASAAAVKVAGLLTRGHVDLEPYVARVNADRCEGTGTCLSQCEYDGALKIVESVIDGRAIRKAVVNEALCTGCGACVAVCPTRAIDINGWTLDQFEAMVDAMCADPVEVASD